MGWYYYSGTVVRPIPVKKGLSKSVRPKSKVEILEMTPEANALIRKGQLRVTSRDKGAVPAAQVPVPQKTVADVVPKSDMAKNVAEKGVTTAATLPPKKPVGNPETTEGEDAAKAKEEADRGADESAAAGEGDDASKKDEDGAEEVDQAEVLNENQRKKRVKRRRS